MGANEACQPPPSDYVTPRSLLQADMIFIHAGILCSAVVLVCAIYAISQSSLQNWARVSHPLTLILLSIDLSFLVCCSAPFFLKTNPWRTFSSKSKTYTALGFSLVSDLCHNASCYLTAVIAWTRYSVMFHSHSVPIFVSKRTLGSLCGIMLVPYLISKICWDIRHTKVQACRKPNDSHQLIQIVYTPEITPTALLVWLIYVNGLYFIAPSLLILFFTIRFLQDFFHSRESTCILDDNYWIAREGMVYHLLLVVKYLLLVLLPRTAYFIIQQIIGTKPSPGYLWLDVINLVIRLHYGTTWIMVILILPVMQLTMRNCGNGVASASGSSEISVFKIRAGKSTLFPRRPLTPSSQQYKSLSHSDDTGLSATWSTLHGDLDDY